MIHDLWNDLQQLVETREITQNSVDSVVSLISTIFINRSQKPLKTTKSVPIKLAGQTKTSPG